MATSKTLTPTNETIQIPAMTDAPDASVFSNCIDKEADAINALNSKLTKDWAINTNRRYSLLGFNSSSNQYKATADGYVQVQVWNADSNIEIWFEENQLSIPVTYSGMRSYMFFLRKGLRIWIGGSGSNRSAFIQLIE